MTGKDKEAHYFQLVYDYRECILVDLQVLWTHASQSDLSEDDVDSFARDPPNSVIDFWYLE